MLTIKTPEQRHFWLWASKYQLGNNRKKQLDGVPEKNTLKFLEIINF